MGFHLFIKMSLYVCPQTGKPFFLKWNAEEECFEECFQFPQLSIPVEFKEFVGMAQKREVFHAYTEAFEKHSSEIDLDSFLIHFPAWDVVKQHKSFENVWTEENHKMFQKCLKWFAKQSLDKGVCFAVTWG